MFIQSLDEIKETDDSKTELSNQNKNDEDTEADVLPQQEEKDTGESKSTRVTQKWVKNFDPLLSSLYTNVIRDTYIILTNSKIISL